MRTCIDVMMRIVVQMMSIDRNGTYSDTILDLTNVAFNTSNAIQ